MVFEGKPVASQPLLGMPSMFVLTKLSKLTWNPHTHHLIREGLFLLGCGSRFGIILVGTHVESLPGTTGWLEKQFAGLEKSSFVFTHLPPARKCTEPFASQFSSATENVQFSCLLVGGYIFHLQNLSTYLEGSNQSMPHSLCEPTLLQNFENRPLIPILAWKSPKSVGQAALARHSAWGSLCVFVKGGWKRRKPECAL